MNEKNDAEFDKMPKSCNFNLLNVFVETFILARNRSINLFSSVYSYKQPWQPVIYEHFKSQYNLTVCFMHSFIYYFLLSFIP